MVRSKARDFRALSLLVSALVMLGACDRGGVDSVYRISAEHSGGIIGGTDVNPGAPLTQSVAALLARDPSDPDHVTVCTATFLTQRILLTAAHCIPANAVSRGVQLSVKMSVDVWDESAELVVQDFATHAAYSETTLDNDIAIVKLKEPALQAVPLPYIGSMAEQKSTWKIHAIGYGRTSGAAAPEEDLQGLGRLREVELLSTKFFPTSTSFSVSISSGQGICGGDSGGPALVRTAAGGWGVIGVLSGYTSQGTSECNENGYYTNVLAFSNWIQTNGK